MAALKLVRAVKFLNLSFKASHFPFLFMYVLSFPGNLLVIAFVSYFGAKLHRPRLIGIGCLIMSTGSFLIAMPHFFQGTLVPDLLALHFLCAPVQFRNSTVTEHSTHCFPGINMRPACLTTLRSTALRTSCPVWPITL